MSGQAPTRSPQGGGRILRGGRFGSANPLQPCTPSSPPQPHQSQPLPPFRSRAEAFWEKLNGDEGASLALSFLVHIIILALLAIPIIHEVRNTPAVTTLIPSEETEQMVLGAEVDVDMSLPETDPGNEPDMLALETVSEIPTLDLAAEPKQGTQLPGEAGGDGGELALGGPQMAQPKNAIVAGSFSVWPVPIEGMVGGTFVLGEPGSFPKRYQPYFIAIQIKLPPDRKVYRLSDLSGEVVGTDLYKQRIPAFAYVKGPDNIFLPARGSRNLKIENGIVQLFIRVPGAEAFIKDTIHIRSMILKEQQELVLTFRPM